MKPLTRRKLLKNTLCATAGVLGGRFVNAQSTPQTNANPPSPCSPEAWEKHGIVLEATEPWEAVHVQNLTTRAEPIENGAWRIWYSVGDGKSHYTIACAEGVPGGPLRKIPFVLSAGEPADAPLAIGNLPEGWKPVQASHIQLPNGKHRLYFWVHAPQIHRYLTAESDDGRRYRVLDPLRPVLYHPSDRAAFGVPSPDGLLVRREKSTNLPEGEPLAESRLICNDATNIYQLPDGTFEIYSATLVSVPKEDPAYIPEDNAPGKIRVIDRLTSADGFHFETRRRVIQREAQDPVDLQFYYLAVTHTPKGRVGMLGHYRCAAQTMDLEWCFSEDGANWKRPQRKAWIPRGDPPAPDCFGIYGGSQLIQRDGIWHLFYTGVNHSHNFRQSNGPARQVVMHATAKSIWA